MSLIVGTKITSRLLKAKITAAIRKCLIQLNGLLGNNNALIDERICKMKDNRESKTTINLSFLSVKKKSILFTSVVRNSD